MAKHEYLVKVQQVVGNRRENSVFCSLLNLTTVCASEGVPDRRHMSISSSSSRRTGGHIGVHTYIDSSEDQVFGSFVNEDGGGAAKSDAVGLEGINRSLQVLHLKTVVGDHQSDDQILILGIERIEVRTHRRPVTVVFIWCKYSSAQNLQTYVSGQSILDCSLELT